MDMRYPHENLAISQVKIILDSIWTSNIFSQILMALYCIYKSRLLFDFVFREEKNKQRRSPVADESALYWYCLQLLQAGSEQASY